MGRLASRSLQKMVRWVGAWGWTRPSRTVREGGCCCCWPNVELDREENEDWIPSHPFILQFFMRSLLLLFLCERINQTILLLNAKSEWRLKNERIISRAQRCKRYLGWCFFFQTTLKPRDSSSTSTPQILVLTVLPSRIFYFCFCFCFSYFPEPSFA